MAFTAIPAGAVDADSPLDVTLFGYIKDNDDYLKARAATTTGHTHNQAGTDEGGPVTPADGSVTPIKQAYTIGNTLLIAANTERIGQVGGNWHMVKEIKIVRGGALRINFTAKKDVSQDSVSYRIYRNGTGVGTQRDPDIGYTTYSEDISGWAGGNLVQLYAIMSAGSGSYKDFQLYVDENVVNTD